MHATPMCISWGQRLDRNKILVPQAVQKPMLFNLENDIGESNDVASKHPEVVAELMKQIEQARNDIGDHDRIGKNARFFDPQPRRADVKKH